MKELEGVDIILDLHHRTIERQRVINDILQGIEVDILAKERTRHIVGYLLKGHLVDVVEEHLWQYLDFFGHIKTTVFCQAFYDGLIQVGDRGFSVSTIIFHNYYLLFTIHLILMRVSINSL